MKYVIIGASAAGLAAAEQIRKTDPAGVVTLLTRETDLPYSRPSISYYLKGLVRRGQMRLRTPAYYKEQKIEIVTDVEVTAIDRAKKTVKCGRKVYSYDKLCLCTGSVPFVPPMQNVSGKRNVCGFLTAADAQTVHDLASANTRAVVIGAGLNTPDGAHRQAGHTADALVRVYGHNAGLFVFVHSAGNACLHTGRVIAMTAVHRHGGYTVAVHLYPADGRRILIFIGCQHIAGG